MMKIIVSKHTLLLFIAFLCTDFIYGQTIKGQSPCNPHVPNQLIASFNHGIGLNTINSRLINGQVIKSVPADGSSPLNIHLIGFTSNPGIYDLNGNPQIFSNVKDLLVYIEQNEACNGGINGTGQGRARVRSTDLNYNYTININNGIGNNYNINNYMPVPHCGNIPMVNNITNLNTSMKVAFIDGGYTHGFNYNDLFSSTQGWDFIQDDSTPNAINLHGDMVASVCAGTVSTAAGIDVNQFFKFLSYKVLDETNTGELFDVILAINQAIVDNAKIVNLSLGMFYCPYDICSVVLDDVFKFADDNKVIIVAAAGNNSTDIDKSDQFYFPASLPHDNMIVVGATERCLRNIASFSNTGNRSIDFYTEGNKILTNSGYATGTSFAAPYVAGVVAVLAAKMQNYNHEAVICAMLKSTDYKGWNTKCTTGGVLNFTKALNHGCLNTFNAPTATRQSSKNVSTPLSPTMDSFFSSNELLNISINALEDGVTDIKIFSITGNLIRTEKRSLIKGYNNLQIGYLQQATNGLYIVQARIGNEIISKKCYKNY